MSKEVHVHSREQASVFDETPGLYVPAETAVISITHDECDKLFWVKQEWADVLHLEFYDLSGPSLAYPDAQLFDEDLAEQVESFVERNKDKNFLVHCYAGISRSVAVGQWISETHDHVLHLHATWNTDMANSLVLACLRRKAWEAQLKR